jgi:hypothetical protein
MKGLACQLSVKVSNFRHIVANLKHATEQAVAQLVDDLTALGESKICCLIQCCEAIGADELVLFADAADILADDARRLVSAAFPIGARLDDETLVLGLLGRRRRLATLLAAQSEQ